MGIQFDDRIHDYKHVMKKYAHVPWSKSGPAIRVRRDQNGKWIPVEIIQEAKGKFILSW